MKVDFTIYTLADIAAKEKGSIISGPFGSNIGTKFFQETGVPVIRGNNLSNGYLKFIDNGFVFVSEAKADELNAYAIKDDLIFTAAGTIGQVGLIEGKAKYKKYVISNKQLRVRLDLKKINPIYAYYWFSSPWIVKDILNKNTGSTVPLINLGIIRTLEIKIPNKRVLQDKIASILSSLDSKIELNNRINTKLEAMAKTIYDYWFVQFDFPDVNGKPYKTSSGKMVWNKELKREIPAGWDSILIENVLSNEVSTKRIPASEISLVGSIPVIDQSIDYIAGFTDNNEALIKIDIPRIIFGDHTRILKIINFDFARGADGTQVLLSNNKRLPQYLFYHTLLKIDLSNYGYARHFKFLKEKRIILPDEMIALKFETIVKSFYNMYRDNIFQNQQLSALRDWLLPMLMNGQVKVKDTAEETLSIAAEAKVTYQNKTNL